MLVDVEKLRVLLCLAAICVATGLSSGCAEGDTESGPSDGAPNLRSEIPHGSGPVTSTTADMGGDDAADPTPPDTDTTMTTETCPPTACTIGEARCEGPGLVTCVADTDTPECGVWGSSVACAAGETCVADRCEVPMGCVDNDNDGYGMMCSAGDDCDDANPDAHPGATEICDGADNNCDGATDEGFSVGSACTTGSGACQATGTTECAADGTTTCNAMPVGTAEVCDGIDNDCDGTIDNGVCAICQGDIFEPNDAPADATLVHVDSPIWGYSCPNDTDWFELETQTGVDYHIYVTFPEATSDLLVRGWVDGVNVITGDTAGRDYEEFIVHGDASKTFQIEVVERDSVESFFRVSLVAQANCSAEDGFVPNQSQATAAQLPANWVTEMYMCPGYLSDWYYLGNLTAGDDLYVGIVGDPAGTDLDLHLWGDPDGDGTFERMNGSATFDTTEDFDIPVPHSGPFYVEVRDFLGDGGSYDIGWSVQ